MLSPVLRADSIVSGAPAQRRDEKLRPMALLDRDGVINEDLGYVCTPERFRLIPGAAEAIGTLNRSGYRVVIATNQSGIGRGLYSEDSFHEFMAWVSELLADRGAHFDACFYCPHHPTKATGEVRKSCACRKPAPGMLLAAMRMFPTQIDRSFFVGDRSKDIEAARSAGVRGILFDGRTPIRQLVEIAVGGPSATWERACSRIDSTR